MAIFGAAIFSFATIRQDVVARNQSADEPGAQCKGAEECNRKSLQAYVRAAVASEFAGDVALLQLILGFLGLAGVGATVFYARRAWREAERSANAAHVAIEAAATEGRKRLRPYLFIEHSEWHWMRSPDHSGQIDSWRLSLHWRNFGTTPAKRVLTSIDSQLFDGDIPTDFNFPSNEIWPSADIAPHGGFVTFYFFSVDSLLAAWRNERRLFLWIWAEYDGFPEDGRHRTERCVRIIPAIDPRVAQQPHITDRFVTAFNGSDETCYRRPQTS